MKLAEALLRRKELQQRLDRIQPIMENKNMLFKTIVRRVNAAEGVDEATLHVPKMTLGQVTAEFDYYAKRLRLVDATIQQANWTTEVEGVIGDCDINADYVPPIEDPKDKDELS